MPAMENRVANWEFFPRGLRKQRQLDSDDVI